MVDGSRFCPSCGEPVGDDTGRETDTTPPELKAATVAPADAAAARRSAAGARFLPGALLAAGCYRVIGLIGKGGMGEVYRADDLELGQPVALKFLPQELDRSEHRRERFLTACSFQPGYSTHLAEASSSVQSLATSRVHLP